MKVVVIESSRVMARAAASLLAQRGHEAVIFTDSASALAQVRDDPQVVVVLTGLETIPLDGFETCWALRLIANAGRPLHVIAMSSLAHARNLSEALDAGADDFISKPLIAEELHARLRAAERMTRLQSALWHQARTDQLSGLLNRRAFFEQIEPLCTGTALGIVLCDLDHFKKLNDDHGHDCGDAAIRQTGALLKACAHDNNGIAARFGGEEFIIALPGHDASACTAITNRLCCTLREADLCEKAGTKVALTASFGLAMYHGGEPIEQTIKRADDALYRAKTFGRDRVIGEDVVISDAPVPDTACA